MIPIFSTMGEEREGRAVRGWVLYDADCGFCTRLAWRFGGALERRGYRVVPLQAPWVRERLQLPAEKLLEEMRVLTIEGVHVGGADAVMYLARRMWWALPLYAASLIPGVMHLLRWGYRWIAARRHRFSRTCALPAGGPAGRLRERSRGRRAA